MHLNYSQIHSVQHIVAIEFNDYTANHSAYVERLATCRKLLTYRLYTQRGKFSVGISWCVHHHHHHHHRSILDVGRIILFVLCVGFFVVVLIIFVVDCERMIYLLRIRLQPTSHYMMSKLHDVPICSVSGTLTLLH